MPVAITCKNIQKTYGKGSNAVEALRDVTLEINQGELRMLMGPSGSGKTTLISIIAGILTQSSGECFLDGVELSQLSDEEKTLFRKSHLGFVFQAFNLIPMLNVEENVSVPLLLNGMERKEALPKARAILKEVGLDDKCQAFPPDLSGGQQQRVAIARALVHEPQIVVCDEPTSFLDHDTGMKIMSLLRELINKKGSTLIVVTHDVRIVKFADRIDHLEDGKIVRTVTNGSF
jgi:putative ABC transport system ATP-binding protein